VEDSERTIPTRRDTGSFRDPSGQVFTNDDRVIRALDGNGLEAWKALRSTNFFDQLSSDRRLVPTRQISMDEAGLPGSGWAGALLHERIPFVSYPYEWSFTMLKDAASLTLEILAAALDEDMVMKDATPFNIQWEGARPTFIDIGSLEPLEPGEAWVGYRQFCRQFLYPLMMQAHKDVSFRPWLRGRLDGIAAAEFRQLLNTRDLFRRGVLLHVALQARAERRYQSTDRNVRNEMRQAGFRKELIQNNVKTLRKIVGGLTWEPDGSEWSDYATQEHVTRHRQAKADFLDRAFGNSSLVWDLGANDGFFSKLAADRGAYVVAADGDEAVVDRLYRSLASDGDERILPLVINLDDPSPATGWRHKERTPIERRGTPDLVVMYAVIHHLVIGGNIPVREVVEWLAELNSRVVVEFVPIGDPMTDRLLMNKRPSDVHPDYTEDAFRGHLAGWFEIDDEQPVPDSSRTLFSLRPRD
jgi:hypothetical protein